MRVNKPFKGSLGGVYPELVEWDRDDRCEGLPIISLTKVIYCIMIIYRTKFVMQVPVYHKGVMVMKLIVLNP